MSRAAVVLISLALVGCAGNKAKQIAQPAQIIEVPVKVYVPIDDKLTEPCPIATGSLSEMPEVARKRLKSLEQCNADKAAIRAKQGKPL